MNTTRTVRLFAGATAIAVLGACSDSGPLGPASSRNASGSGTGTLLITADVEVEDESGGGYITRLHASVRDQAGAPVSGASVQINAAGLGIVPLAESPAGSGNYAATHNGAAGTDVRLDVTRGSDNVTRVIIGSPGLHKITSPTGGSVVPAGQALTVRWTVPRRALRVEIETRDGEVDDLADNGVHALSGASNPARTGQRIRVYRFNEVAIAGGRAGSRLRISVRDTVEPLTVQ